MQAMTMNLINVDNYVKIHDIPEVKSARMLRGNVVNEDGLFSMDIFGPFGSLERFNQMAYVNLHKKFLHPFAIQLLKVDSMFNHIIGGGSYRKNGKLIEIVSDDYEGNDKLFGMDDLYKNWSYFVGSIKDTGTDSRKDTIEFFNRFSADEVWLSKWPILPAGLRDINMMELENTGVVNYAPINDLYVTLLRQAAQLENSSGDIFEGLVFSDIEMKLQSTLAEIHDYIVRGTLSGKDKFIRKNTLKKTVMYSVGAVIAMPNTITETFNDPKSSNITNGTIGVPVSVLIDVFYPFVLHYMQQYYDMDPYIEDFIRNNLLRDPGEEKTSAELIELFLDTCINDMNFLAKDMFEKDERLKGYLVMDFLKNDILLPITGTKENPKRYVSVTRYPIERWKSTQFLFPIPYTTSNTKIITDENGMEREITLDPKNYSTVAIPSQSSLKSWGGDFDGDKVSILGIFTNESNADVVKKRALFRLNSLDNALKPTAFMGLESLFGLHCMTR